MGQRRCRAMGAGSVARVAPCGPASTVAAQLLMQLWLIVHHMKWQTWLRDSFINPVNAYQIPLRLGFATRRPCSGGGTAVCR